MALPATRRKRLQPRRIPSGPLSFAALVRSPHVPEAEDVEEIVSYRPRAAKPNSTVNAMKTMELESFMTHPHTAWFDPNLAAYLLERPVKNAAATKYNINLRRLMAAANAAPENVGDSGN